MTGRTSHPTSGMPPELVQFSLPLTPEQVLAEIKKGRAEARRLRNAEPHRKVPDSVPVSGFDWHGKALAIPKMSWLDNFRVDLGGGGSRRLKKKTGLREVPAEPRTPTPKPDGSIDLGAADGHVWPIAEAGSGFALGSEVALTSGGAVCGTKAVYAHGEKRVFVEQVPLAEVAG